MGRPLPRLPGIGLSTVPDVHVLGVRHHGPGSARAVGEALTELQALSPSPLVQGTIAWVEWKMLSP